MLSANFLNQEIAAVSQSFSMTAADSPQQRLTLQPMTFVTVAIFSAADKVKPPPRIV